MAPNREETGIVFNIQHYSLHDGPGIRTAVFLKGCPLRCIWCANPESQVRERELVWKEEACIGCQSCVKLLPKGEFHFEATGLCWNHVEDRDHACKVCPSQALHMIGEEKTVSQVLDIVERDAAFYETSHGGLTLSGGEPLGQPAFAIALLKEAKRRHIHTAIETSGYTKWETFREAAQYLDYMQLDIKVWDDALHRRVTGVSNQLILENFRRVREAYPQLPIRVRTPVVPDINDNEEELGRIAELVHSYPNTEYELLKYHRLGLPKYQLLRRAYGMGHVELPEYRFQELKQAVGSL